MVLESTSQITKEWLQQTINQFYPQAQIKNVTLNCGNSRHANNAIINIEYCEDHHSYPTSFFLKICQNCAYFITDSEYDYYKKDYVDLKNAPIPVCYDAQYSESGYHLLLEDLSATHYSNQDIEPTQQHAIELAKELARLHAFYWQEDSPISAVDKYIEKTSQGLPAIFSHTSLSQQDKISIGNIIENCGQKFYERQQYRNGFTKIHGDANPCNVMSPYDKKGKTYIIDRQPFLWSLTHFLGMYDLVYATIPCWETDKRRSFEMTTLQTYHRNLQKFGVQNYSWEQCLDDYRLCIILAFYVPISWGLSEKSMKEMQWLWEKQLRRLLQASRDWS
ncbi:hypothetical protein [Candidatus Uabimicrobium amorphum]|uniref:Aminoglycoside phosphotransferase n=1 Tax=Uabimicrobium amorphum TaxID=2596890 RepID=A0A5S9ISP4_UABAM|nr:hypothetical protein [Candidatus Uabimicrobium amorphum]BBM86711.1 aminoglycoside phosphotransferase [Candidatus Uabimicrobium amorphum]